MEIRFQKLYRYRREREHCQVAIPFAEGVLREESRVQIYQDGHLVPSQKKVTSRYGDGSIRYLFVRFLADLPANKKAVLNAEFDSGDIYEQPRAEEYAAKAAHGARGEQERCLPYSISGPDAALTVTAYGEGGYEVNTGGGTGIRFAVSDRAQGVFDWLEDGRKRYGAEQFAGPFLEDGEGNRYGVRLGKWHAAETGPLVCVLRCMGECTGEKAVTFELKVTAYAGKPWVEISFRLINSTPDALHVASLVFAVMAGEDAVYDAALTGGTGKTGWKAGEKTEKERSGFGFVQELELEASGGSRQKIPAGRNCYHTTGILELPVIQDAIGTGTVRTCAGRSNYKTDFCIGRDGAAVEKTVDAASLVAEANEHFAEVFYGTFFADRTDGDGGVCATIYQAQQNYPKAVKADGSGVYVMLVPKGVDRVEMESGMSREQRFLLHFHSAGESLTEIDNRSLIYQMPDKPSIAPEVFRDAGVMPDIFVDRGKTNDDVEIALIGKCDGHARCFGMLNWGDAPDAGYTTQGRGGGMPVWTNNEYDFPHACALLYARTGERRFLDYMVTAASHWMDVDVCHYSSDPLLFGGQWEHTRGHCKDGVVVCSHEWVEGLLDAYHFTGDERALETALGIGENVLRLLETPMYRTSGESSARETGWALRTLTALYVETNDPKWLEKCRWIAGQFKEWAEKYGGWLAPYTDNTLIRVGFMISVAVGSLMRYYRVLPAKHPSGIRENMENQIIQETQEIQKIRESQENQTIQEIQGIQEKEEIRKMILDAVNDLVENCLLDNGLFYYKELPSLNRLGGNTLLLEALTIAYELSGDSRYLTYGKRTFWSSIHAPSPSAAGVKSIVGDAVIHKTAGTKNFAQSFIPLSVYYKALSENGMV